MATLIQALIGYQLGDDPAIDRSSFMGAIDLFDSGDMTAAEIKTAFGLTTGQGNELDEIIATRPGALQSILIKSQWSPKIYGVLAMGAMGSVSGYETPNDCRDKLGL